MSFWESIVSFYFWILFHFMFIPLFLFSIVLQFSSAAQLCPTLCHLIDCSTPGFPVHHQHPKLAQIHVHQVSDTIQPPHPLLSPSPLALNLSQHQDFFQWVSSSHQAAKYWSFNFSNSSSNLYSGLISFRINLFHLLAAHGTLKNLLQHHSSKASILWHSSFFMVQLSHPCMTTGKTIAFTRWIFCQQSEVSCITRTDI